MIKIEHLQKYFNCGKRSELHVLNDITLELPQTGLVCILGESGSGKTTLLNTIGGLDVFQGGTLTVDETILKKYEPKKIEHLRCEKFGYIFQNYYLLQDYTVAYNVKLALSHYDLTDEEKGQLRFKDGVTQTRVMVKATIEHVDKNGDVKLEFYLSSKAECEGAQEEIGLKTKVEDEK